VLLLCVDNMWLARVLMHAPCSVTVTIIIFCHRLVSWCAVVTGLKHELLEKDTEVSDLKSELKSLHSVVRLAQDMFRIIDKCDNTDYRGQFDQNLANCLRR
jgi:hypothetical protein